jgi:hypothetical protein
VTRSPGATFFWPLFFASIFSAIVIPIHVLSDSRQLSDASCQLDTTTPCLIRWRLASVG